MGFQVPQECLRVNPGVLCGFNSPIIQVGNLLHFCGLSSLWPGPRWSHTYCELWFTGNPVKLPTWDWDNSIPIGNHIHDLIYTREQIPRWCKLVLPQKNKWGQINNWCHSSIVQWKLVGPNAQLMEICLSCNKVSGAKSPAGVNYPKLQGVQWVKFQMGVNPHLRIGDTPE